ncbi:MAG: hypothetical protein ACI8XO_000595 [Verrucomicrobiales bacterium]
MWRENHLADGLVYQPETSDNLGSWISDVETQVVGGDEELELVAVRFGLEGASQYFRLVIGVAEQLDLVRPGFLIGS